MDEHAIIVGGGIGGLAAAIDLASRGVRVTLLERAKAVGGKARSVTVHGRQVEGGPTVFTMRWVFEQLFADAGASLAAAVHLGQAEVLARHAWSETERLDLFGDVNRSADAIGAFSGKAEAKRFLAFAARARDVYQTLEGPFLRSTKPNPMSLVQRVGPTRLGDLLRLRPLSTLWKALGDHFEDPRLRQLYGRYATYCGSSPFEAPATLMLVAHVEQDGVWYVEGGISALARALSDLATRHGATIRTGEEVSRIRTSGGRVSGVKLASGEELAADAVIFNGDADAVARGLLGPDVSSAVGSIAPHARSLSAVVWTMVGKPEGFPLLRHNVFFSRGYKAEFDAIFERGELPDEPTVYICAQDRGDTVEAPGEGERLLVLVNAPAIGDTYRFEEEEIGKCQERTIHRLKECGLHLPFDPASTTVTTPSDFTTLFPSTGGALYGRATHGWMSTFQRPDGRTKIPGLFLAGGSVHPGPGVPMAALSGRLAARGVFQDLTSARKFRRVGIVGGMLTH